MAERFITVDEIEFVIDKGEIIRAYMEDKPYPSFLLLGFSNNRPIHLVVAKNTEDDTCILITAYIPDTDIWDTTFKIKNS